MKELVLSVIFSLVTPPADSKYESFYDALDRYEEIATDISEAAEVGPWLFSGSAAAEKTALMLTAISFMESRFHHGVDTGRINGDYGSSVCVFQLNVGNGKTVEGWDRHELIDDRKRCVRSALNLAARCGGLCRGRPGGWLRAYGSGSCERGGKAASKRWALYHRLRRRWLR